MPVSNQNVNLREETASWRSCPSAGPAAPSIIQSDWNPIMRQKEREKKNNLVTEAPHSITQTPDGQPSSLISGWDQGCLKLWGPTMAQKDLRGNTHPSAGALMLFCCLQASGWISLTRLGSLLSLYSVCHKSVARFASVNSNPFLCASVLLLKLNHYLMAVR